MQRTGSVPSKLALVGNEAVGKSSFARVCIQKPFSKEHLPTFEDEYQLFYPGAALTLLDTAGSSGFDRLRPMSYAGITAFVVCFAVDERRSLRDVEERWVPELRYYAPGCEFALMATKVDLRQDQETAARLRVNGEEPVSKEEGAEVATRIGATSYAECSALDRVIRLRALSKHVREKSIQAPVFGYAYLWPASFANSNANSTKHSEIVAPETLHYRHLSEPDPKTVVATNRILITNIFFGHPQATVAQYRLIASGKNSDNCAGNTPKAPGFISH
ncbi:hypothetical protein HKX48_000177 [Thoreauomyces humboldtii]|nr:hypothetical protein HKX48_000177 [Thoreauomyces humboldtii]